MSTKIYDGLRLRDNTKLWEFRDWITTHYKRIKQRKQMGELTERAVNMFDAYTMGIVPTFIDEIKRVDGVEDNEEPTLRAFLKYIVFEELTKRDNSNLRNDSLDSIGVFHNPIRDEIYLYPYMNLPEISELLQDGEYTEFFGYWNNSDHPDGLSDEDWADRLKCWEEAVNLNFSFGSQGMQMVLEDIYDRVVMLSDYINYITNESSTDIFFPSYKSRCFNAARNILIKEYLDNPNNPKDGALSYMMNSKNIEAKIPTVEDKIMPLTVEDYREIIKSSQKPKESIG